MSFKIKSQKDKKIKDNEGVPFMAKQRYINTKFWFDDYIINLNSLEKYLFLYFLCNNHTEICGIYELSMKIILFETGLEENQFNLIINKIKEKILYLDGWVCIRNFIKNQQINPSVRKGIERVFLDVPDKILNQLKNVWSEFDKILVEYNRVLEPLKTSNSLSTVCQSLSKPATYLNLNLNLNPQGGVQGGVLKNSINSGKNTKAVDNLAKSDNTSGIKQTTSGIKKSHNLEHLAGGLKAFRQVFPAGVGSFAELRKAIKCYKLKPFFGGGQMSNNLERYQSANGQWRDFKGSHKAIELRERR